MSERLYNIEAIASRILTQGSYARVSQDETRAMAEWIALQLEAMRRLNDRTLGIEPSASRSPLPLAGVGKLPASLAATVARLLEANRELERLRAICASGTDTAHDRNDLVSAIESFNDAMSTLKTRFEKEFPNGSA